MLSGVTAVSANDVWAVGTASYSGSGNETRTLVEHWNGTEWLMVPSPSIAHYSVLTAVDAITTNDVWAVGNYNDEFGPSRALVEHWDGTSWSVVSSVDLEPNYVGLYAITALSANDVWAVGAYGPTSSWRGLVEHWDGTSWSLVPVDNISPYYDWLSAITAIGPSDIWAVGQFAIDGNLNMQTLVEHYSTTCTAPIPTIPVPQTVTATGTPPTATATATETATPTATGTPVCLYSWHEVLSQNLPSSDESFLNGVVAISADDAWAVGQSWDNQAGGTALLEHWDGEEWSIAAAPVISSENVLLFGVWAAASNDVWAVGTRIGTPQTLTLHWDGTAWSVVPSPNPSQSGDILYAVAGTSSDDVWAVGTAILHWDGTEWNAVQEPIDGTLNGISVLPGGEIWAVGVLGGSDPTAYQTLTLHWNGVAWSVVPSPNIGTATNSLKAVKAISTNDVWAVGTYVSNSTTLNLAMHWDGTQWTLVDIPSPDASNSLNGIAALSSDDVWAVGASGSDDYVRYVRTVTLHWNGTEWTRSVSPNPANINSLNAVTTMPEDELWAVGGTGGPTDRTLALRYSSTTFSDIPQGHTFYPYINCISCRGIALGYPDGTFRSNNPITRGQIAKLVVIASRPIGEVAEIMQPEGAQLFEDVPYGSTFYDYVQAIGEVVEGYPCGGPGEPCVPPDNLPYYRPGNTASRGQLTKIVAEVAGFNDQIPAGTQTFADVLENSTFYVFIERLILNRPGVMVGYPCGGYGEPCDLQNRAYFRPASTVTRGQAAKIVANTFFPNCQPPAP
jgi:hypothetical protein